MRRMAQQAAREPRQQQVEERWLVCLGETRVVEDGRVWCDIAGSTMPIPTCLRCRYLETLAGERDDMACSLGVDLSRPRPR